MRQEVRFVRSADGTRIAWARHGHGPPLVRVSTWLTNLESDWTSPIWKPWLVGLGEHFTVVPSLFMIATDDEMPGAVPRVARAAFEEARSTKKELCEIEGGHFGLLHYPSALFDLASAKQASFLLRHLN